MESLRKIGYTLLRNLFLLLCASGLTALVTCTGIGPQNPSPNGPVIRGVLPTDLRATSHTELQTQSLGTAVTRVGSIRIVAGNMNIQAVVSVPVQPDGSFEIPFSPQDAGNQLLITMNPDATDPIERSQGVIALANGSGINLAALPLDNVFDDLDLGSLNFDPATRESLSSLSSLQQSELFGLSAEELIDVIVRTNGARAFVTTFANYRESGAGQFGVKQEVGSYIRLVDSGGIHGWTDHLVWLDEQTFRTLEFRMPIPDDDIDFERVSSGELTLLLTPPYEIAARNNEVFGPDRPVRFSGSGDWSNAEALGANFNVWEEEPDGGLYLGFGTSEEISAGVWILEIEGGRQLAIADTSSDITSTADGTYLYYLPSVRLDVDTVTGRIERIRFRMYRYSAVAGTYVHASPEEWRDRMMELGLQITYRDSDSEQGSEWFFGSDVGPEIVPQTEIYVARDVYPPAPDDGFELESISFLFKMHEIMFLHGFY